MRRRGLLAAPLLTLLPAMAGAQGMGLGTGAPPPPPLPPLPAVSLIPGITLLEPGAWRVEFPPEGEELTAPRRAVLARIAAVLSTGSEGRVTLIAEVSQGADLSTMRRLSLARARAVRAALVAGGLAETRIDIRAMGQTDARRDVVDVLAPTVTKP